MNALNTVVKKLQDKGVIDLNDFKSLRVEELEVLSEELLSWCVYGNGKPENIGRHQLKKLQT